MKRQATYYFKHKAQRFTIRKLNIGLASVVFGTLFYLNVSEDLQAAETIKASPISLQKKVRFLLIILQIINLKHMMA
ncbi:YSIRK-type signal peptide-containing protein [Staphylococcus agnetis]|uniref:YSIRK-type signal peptide-containing protein n=1 Tax=Staphylococcus agnetis TaxID=985762 RepID=UPI0016483A7D|nr:YSIRK-type signal peptide-containing protein [Staphylococcus agnetis]